jgi:hypothetical protein
LEKNTLAKGNFYLSLLADSASFLLSNSENWKRKPAVIVELDHLNAANDGNDLRELKILKCNRFEDLKDDCEVIQTRV